VRILFMGTPSFAVPSLEHLLDSRHRVVGVVTQPDRPRGRGQRVTPGAVKTLATEREVPVLQPERLSDADVLAAIRTLTPDLAVVAAYGRLLPQVMLDLPRLGVINVHASLLPRWRGAAPVHRAIIAGDTETGITIMRVVLALDAGPILSKVSTPIDPNETSVELENRLATLGAGELLSVVDRLERDNISGEPQNGALVTYAKRLERRDSDVDWARPALAVHDQIRGLQPWPIAVGQLKGRRISLLRATVEHSRELQVAPGTVVAAGPDGLIVATRPGAIRVIEVQEAGRAVMSVGAYLNGRPIAAGDRFEPIPTGSA
jgi:methionyl-tRNA formyltransferase